MIGEGQRKGGMGRRGRMMEYVKRHYIVGKQYGRLKERKEHTSKMNQGLMIEDCKQ